MKMSLVEIFIKKMIIIIFMKRIIMVGGLQYSGKTTFCRHIENDNDRVKYISLDDISKKFYSDDDLLFNTIKKYDMADDLVKISESKNMNDSEFHEECAKICSLLHISREIIMPNNNKISTYLIDGIFYNKATRALLLNSLEYRLNEFEKLDSFDKKFIYFDLGLDLSLNRHEKYNYKRNNSLECTKEYIANTYSSQEIPTNDELKGVEIKIIRNQSDYNKELENIKLRL